MLFLFFYLISLLFYFLLQLLQYIVYRVEITSLDSPRSPQETGFVETRLVVGLLVTSWLRRHLHHQILILPFGYWRYSCTVSSSQGLTTTICQEHRGRWSHRGTQLGYRWTLSRRSGSCHKFLPCRHRSQHRGTKNWCDLQVLTLVPTSVTVQKFVPLCRSSFRHKLHHHPQWRLGRYTCVEETDAPSSFGVVAEAEA